MSAFNGPTVDDILGREVVLWEGETIGSSTPRMPETNFTGYTRVILDLTQHQGRIAIGKKTLARRPAVTWHSCREPEFRWPVQVIPAKAGMAVNSQPT